MNIKFLLILLIIVSFFIYVSRKLQQQQTNCKSLATLKNTGYIPYDKLKTIDNYFDTTIKVNQQDISYNYKLKDFYIKTAYNACCSGRFKNDYVDLCALKNCAKHGVRALDFQIYSVEGEPIVAASSVNSSLFKETFNYLTLEKVITEVKKQFLSGGKEDYHELKNDPLFLFFRIKYGQKSDTAKSNPDYNDDKRIIAFYNTIYDVLKNKLGDKFNDLNSIKNGVYDMTKSDKNFNEKSIDLTNKFTKICYRDMSDLKQNIFLFIEIDEVNSSNILDKTCNLGSICDGLIEPASLILHRYNEIENNDLQIANQNKQNLSLCLPELSSSSKNYDIVKPLKLGVQFIAMNFQTNDVNIQYYNDLFKMNLPSSSVNVSYVKKPETMISFPSSLSALYKSL